MGKTTFEDPQERRKGHKTEPLFTGTLCFKTLEQLSDLFLEFPPFLLPSSFSLSFGSPVVLLEVSALPLASPSLGSLRMNLDVILLIIPVDVPLLACAKAPGS